MSTASKIEWTDATWNPVTGCTKVSAGCKHCYAERQWPRLSAPGQPYEGRAFTSVRTHPERLDQPLRWKRPRRIFVNSMSDLFHERVPWHPPGPGEALVLNAMEGRVDHFQQGRAIPEKCAALDWVICGGESGPLARPMHPDWVRDLRDQCVDSGVAFLLKQWGEWAPGECCGPPTRTERAAWWQEDWQRGERWLYGRVTVRESFEMHRDYQPEVYCVGKRHAGRLLDGELWDQYPEARP